MSTQRDRITHGICSLGSPCILWGREGKPFTQITRCVVQNVKSELGPMEAQKESYVPLQTHRMLKGTGSI